MADAAFVWAWLSGAVDPVVAGRLFDDGGRLAGIIRHRFVEPHATLHELFGRIVFNILCGNTNDHARNHAAFWDCATLAMTPAYDNSPSRARMANRHRPC